MARMVPATLRPETESMAERKLYDLFREQLGARWTVFHRVAWQLRDVHTGVRDGETDFVLVHPAFGILILEVKGGIIRYDGLTQQWFSHEHHIKDPGEQARRNKYSLRQLLEESPYWHGRNPLIAYAVAFPDTTITQTRLLPDLPRAITMDLGDTQDLTCWEESVFAYYRGSERGEAFGDAGINELIKLLSPSLTLRPLLGDSIPDEQRALLHVTEDQYEILYTLSSVRQASIRGCAGSGKTLIAIEKARRLSQQGFSVLLVCFNRNLALILREDLALLSGIRVAHFHDLCLDLSHQARLETVRPKNIAEDAWFDQILPDRLIEAAAQLDWSVDAIIVDEGQDFQEAWLQALRCLLTDPHKGIFYCFYDDNQNLYHNQMQAMLPEVTHPLRKNCRNTQTISAFVRRYYRAYQDLPLVALGPGGRPITVIDYHTKEELRQGLRHQLHRLIAVEHVEPGNIVVLTPHSVANTALRSMTTMGNMRLVFIPTESNGEILCTSIHQFKGLESPVIILVELEFGTIPNLDTLIYVGASRAGSDLIIIKHADLQLHEQI